MPFIWMYQTDGSRNLNGRVPKLWRDACLKSTSDPNLFPLVVGLKEIIKAPETAGRQEELHQDARLLDEAGFPTGLNAPLWIKVWMQTALVWRDNTRAGHNSWSKGATERFLRDYDARDQRLCDAARPQNRPKGIYLFRTREADATGKQ